MLRAEKYAAETLGSQQAFIWVFAFMAKHSKEISYQEYPEFTIQTVGANLLQPFSAPRYWNLRRRP